jgi:hypothetical protein
MYARADRAGGHACGIRVPALRRLESALHPNAGSRGRARIGRSKNILRMKVKKRDRLATVSLKSLGTDLTPVAVAFRRALDLPSALPNGVCGLADDIEYEGGV